MEPKRIGSAIFDLDGTLWDPTVTAAKAWTRALADKRIDREITSQDMHRISGMKPVEFLPLLFPDIEDTNVLYEALSRKEAEYLRREGGMLFTGVEAGLKKLSRHIPLSLVSNCQASYMDAFLEWSGFERFFVEVESHGRLGLDKYENILMVIDRGSLIDPVYIGDTPSDRDAASKAGIPFIQITNGIRPRIESELNFDDFSSLIDHIIEFRTISR
ncbi:MAG: HAD hydrolase-like protein [Candidatus Thermoplasmatota archaeon]|nr:HAD hydrolase-like protein [Candidatus Thermoplasmatota archaeon]